jgi:hypothetical protein
MYLCSGEKGAFAKGGCKLPTQSPNKRTIFAGATTVKSEMIEKDDVKLNKNNLQLWLLRKKIY